MGRGIRIFIVLAMILFMFTGCLWSDRQSRRRPPARVPANRVYEGDRQRQRPADDDSGYDGSDYDDTESARPARRESTRRESAPRQSDFRKNSSDEQAEAYAYEVLDLVNAERRKAGVRTLSWGGSIAPIADKRAREIVSKFSHTRPNGQSWDSLLVENRIKKSAWGENIAAGQKTPEDVMDSWMNSSGHRKNILNSNYTQLAVGVYRDSNGRLNWVQTFLKP